MDEFLTGLLGIGVVRFVYENLTLLLIPVVFFLCLKWAKKAKHSDNIGNYAQYALSAGVLGTFVGILISLHGFNVDAIQESINTFLGGMKFAFVTSVIGMGFSFYIKHIQSDVEARQEKSQEDNNNAISVHIPQIAKATLASSAAIEDMQKDIAANTAGMTAMNQGFQAVTASLREVSQSLADSSNASLAKNIDMLSQMISGMAASTQENTEMTRKMVAAMAVQNQAIAAIKDGLLDDSKRQYAIMQSMGENIAQMQDLSQKSYAVSTELFSQSVEFQKHMVESSHNQESILAENNQGLKEMRASFDAFLEKMSDSFSKSFIEALTQSIEKLNVELQEQLGGNFQKLNQAVTDLLDWQIHYKEIIEETQKELQASQNHMETFLISVNEFEKQAGETMPQLLSEMGNRLQGFESALHEMDNTLQGVHGSLNSFDEGMKERLEAYTAQMGAELQKFGDDMHQRMDKYDAGMEASLQDFAGKLGETNEKFGQVIMTGVAHLNEELRNFMVENNQKVCQQIDAAFTDMNKNMLETIDNIQRNFQSGLKSGMEQSFNVMLAALNEQQAKFVGAADVQMQSNAEMLMKVTEQSMNKLNEMIGISLQNMDKSMNDNIQVTMEALKDDLMELHKGIAGASEQQVKELGAALVAITNKMTDNYKTLMDRLEELNNFLIANRGR